MEYYLLIFGLVALVFGGEILVRGAVGISLKLRLSTMLVGLTIVSIGTSAPELLVSVKAALNNHPDIAIGNILGSNICNLGLVLGLTGIAFPLVIKQGTIKFDWPILIVATGLLNLFILDRTLELWEGIVFISLLIWYIGLLIYKNRKYNENNAVDEDLSTERNAPLWRNILYIIGGCVALIYGADWLVEGAVDIARSFDISERVIALSLVAFGTSIPELATSLIAAFKKQTDISVGNLIGSNIFNILSILGITSIIKTIDINPQIITFDMLWVLGIAVLLLPLMLIRKKIGVVEGLILLITYGVYMYFIL